MIMMMTTIAATFKDRSEPTQLAHTGTMRTLGVHHRRIAWGVVGARMPPWQEKMKLNLEG